MPNYIAINTCNISEPTYIKLKGYILKNIKEEINNRSIKIGGIGSVIQVDETAICRGSIIINPSSTEDEIANTTWLVGGIEEGNLQRIFLKIVPNRKSSTIKSLFDEKVEIGTIIKTDRHASYPSAVFDHGSIHLTVNHSEGFTTEDGIHTNNIENL